jgi:ABC-2 type transport system ATP-binding protein
MKQRLSLARALLADPPVLLLDEPTRSLDPLAQDEFRDFVRTTLVGRLHKTVILSTHSLEEAQYACNRIAILRRGSLVHVGPAAHSAVTFNAVLSDATSPRRATAG